MSGYHKYKDTQTIAKKKDVQASLTGAHNRKKSRIPYKNIWEKLITRKAILYAVHQVLKMKYACFSNIYLQSYVLQTHIHIAICNQYLRWLPIYTG